VLEVELLFWLKHAPHRLSSLGSLEHFPYLVTAFRGLLLREEGREGEGKDRNGREGKERDGKEKREEKGVWLAHFSYASAAYAKECICGVRNNIKTSTYCCHQLQYQSITFTGHYN